MTRYQKVLWWAMTKKDILKKYINIMQDMYQEVKKIVSTCGRATEDVNARP